VMSVWQWLSRSAFFLYFNWEYLLTLCPSLYISLLQTYWPATISTGPSADVKDVGYVINYDFPNNCEDYIHRIGRTGRAGMKGVSYTYFTTDNAKSARELISILKEAKAIVPPQLEEMGIYGGGGGRGRYGGGGGRGRGGGTNGRYGGGFDNHGTRGDRW